MSKAPKTKPLAFTGDTAPALRRLNQVFTRAIPQGARGGAYQPRDGEEFFETQVQAPDGAYRILGSDWVFTIAKGKFVSALMATADNKFGGADVKTIDNG